MLESFKSKLSSVREGAGWNDDGGEAEEEALADEEDDSGWYDQFLA